MALLKPRRAGVAGRGTFAYGSRMRVTSEVPSLSVVYESVVCTFPQLSWGECLIPREGKARKFQPLMEGGREVSVASVMPL